jgi:long-chain acyl-CoA synthetase
VNLHERLRPLRTLDRSLTEVIELTARAVPDKPALLFEDESVSYGVVFEHMRRVAGYLIERGLHPGDRVAMHVDNRPEFAYVAGGILLAGGVMVALNVMYLEEEVRYILEDSDARMVFAIEKLASRTRAAASRLPLLEEIVVIGGATAGCTPFAAVLEHAPADGIRHRAGSDVAMLQYTSGTTGRPKGAMLTHANIVSCLDMMTDLERSRAGDDDVVLLVLPLFHCYGLIVGLFGCLAWGSTTVLVNRFDPTEIFGLFEKHRVTVFYGAPPMFVAFVNTPGLERFDVSSLDRCGSGAAPLPVPVLERFERLTGVEILEGYGLTETAPTLTTNGNAATPRAGTVGKPLNGVEIRIVDDAGREVPVGETGELLARGANIFAGYWKNPEATREALRDGWFHTGDMARLDRDGYYTIVDRKKDMIIVSGYNVYPAEVENALFHHPAVADAAVIGVPDPYQGESVKAVVVRRAGSNPTEDEIIAFMRERVAAFKAPRSVAFVEALPKNRTGKVLKRELREQFAAGRPA